jgi:ADP-ribose pyrophosphatase YjhB (NUDIX family)
MKKGIDYTGITVCFHCHDGEGNYAIHKRSARCRDEQGRWDFGGGGLKFGETLEDGVRREVLEEYGAESKEIEYIGFDEIFREHGGEKTHWISVRFRVLVDPEQVKNNEPEKMDEIRWVTTDNLPKPLHSQLGWLIEKYKDKF